MVMVRLIRNGEKIGGWTNEWPDFGRSRSKSLLISGSPSDQTPTQGDVIIGGFGEPDDPLKLSNSRSII